MTVIEFSDRDGPLGTVTVQGGKLAASSAGLASLTEGMDAEAFVAKYADWSNGYLHAKEVRR